MALPGPPPKDPDRRARRNKDTLAAATAAGWTILPAEGRQGDAPALPTQRPAWKKATRDWWAAIWRSPMATQWLEADLGALLRLARLTDRQGRKTESSTDAAEIRQLEDRFGLNPESRQKKRWKIAEPVDDAEADDAPPKRGRGKKAAAAAAPADPRLKLVKGGRYT